MVQYAWLCRTPPRRRRRLHVPPYPHPLRRLEEVTVICTKMHTRVS